MKKIFNTLKNTYQINTVSSVNTFIYYLSRIPFIKKLIKDSIYKNIIIKQVITVFVCINKFFLGFIYKGAYIAAFMGLPISLAFSDSPAQNDEIMSYFYYIFFILSFLYGSLAKPVAFILNQKNYQCVRLMGMKANEYFVAKIINHHVFDFIFFTPCILVFAIINNSSIINALIFSLLLVCSRFIGDALSTVIFEKSKYIFANKNWIVITFSVLSLGIAYIPLFLKANINGINLVFNPVMFLIFIIIGALSCVYVLRYKNYKKIFMETHIATKLFANTEKIYQEAMFGKVKMQDKDLVNGNQSQIDNNKSGYNYLNDIFFSRHRRIIFKPVILQSIVIAAVFAVSIFGIIAFPEAKSGANEILEKILPFTIFLMYMISICPKATLAMFYNCDISLLRYPFFKEKSVVLKTFKLRLKKITLIGLIPAVEIAIFLLILSFMTMGVQGLITTAPIALAVLLLSVFFTVHHLFLYYIIQPYTTELNVKNPLFNIINGATYMICFLCLQIKSVPVNFVLYILGITIIYIIIALALVFKFAPKTFRVK